MTTPAEGTPAPAPVDPAQTPPAPAPEPAPISDPAPAAAPDIIVYDPTGDPGLDIALEFVGNLGIGADHPAMQAAMKGDYSLLEYTFQQMGDQAKGWERHVALAKAADEKVAQAADQRARDTEAACVQAAGGAEQWEAIKEWSVANATPDEKAAINAMFDAGPIQARIAVTAMRSLFSQAPGTVLNPKDPTRNIAGDTAKANGALSPREYHKEVTALRQRLGRDFETSDDYAALQRRLRR